MSKQFFIVSVPLVVVRNFIVAAPSKEAAEQVVARASGDFFRQSMHSERMVGLFETFEGVPVSVTPMTDLLSETKIQDPDLGVLS